MSQRRDDDYRDVPEELRRMRAEPDEKKRERVRADIIDRCLPLAEHVARRFVDRGEPFDDLVQVARIGLINALDRFDDERGGSFLAYAVPTVMGEVRRHFRDATWAVRVPRRAKEAYLSTSRATEELVQQLGRAPRPSEIAAHMGVSVDEVIEGLTARAAYSTDSIDAPMGGDDGDNRSIGESLGEDDERLARIDEFVALRPALERLPERERRILTLRFFKSMSQSEIAAQVGISQMHVSRLLARTLKQLREEINVEAEAGGPETAESGS